MTTNWENEVEIIKTNFINAGNPLKFFENANKNFKPPRVDDATIIPTIWFEEPCTYLSTIF